MKLQTMKRNLSSSAATDLKTRVLLAKMIILPHIDSSVSFPFLCCRKVLLLALD